MPHVPGRKTNRISFYHSIKLSKRKNNLRGVEAVGEREGQVVIHEVVDRPNPINKRPHSLFRNIPAHSEFEPREDGTSVCKEISTEGDVFEPGNEEGHHMRISHSGEIGKGAGCWVGNRKVIRGGYGRNGARSRIMLSRKSERFFEQTVL